jgi:serine/threonine protein kinase
VTVKRPEPAIGDDVGPYRLEATLGRGATGVVFRAVDRQEGTTVALKVLRAELSADETYVRRFLREVRAAQEVRDDHLVPILSSGVSAGRYYLTAQYADHGSLADRLADERVLALKECTAIAGAVASGLDALHQRGLVHRDVKPGNIMLAADGRVMLTDFGLARSEAYTVLTTPGRPVGTPDYMAPELFLGEAATPASDIYALGCVVYACITGRAPFAGRRLIEVAAAHLDEQPRPPKELRADLSPEGSWVVERALEKEPGQRPATATAFARMFRSAMTP